MKLGIISDIHGEIENLHNALSLLQDIECKIVCLGDLVSEDSSDNDQCINLIKEKNITTVIGQHDDTCIKVNSPPISDSSCSFLKSLPVFLELDNIYLVHDNPLERARKGQGMWKSGNYIKSFLEAEVVFEELNSTQVKTQFFLIGHTHVPKIFSSKNGEINYSFNEPVQLENDNKYIINPGRLGGVDRESMGVTCAFLDTDNYLVRIFRI
ncbi:MAG: metallophosphoesterase family protein [Parcubacteria group bacterium]